MKWSSENLEVSADPMRSKDIGVVSGLADRAIPNKASWNERKLEFD